MVLIFYSALNVLVLFLFIRYGRKNLHILEVLVYWMVGSYLFQNYTALCYMNFKTIIIPENLGLEFSHVINRIVLVPVLLVTFLNFYLYLSTNYKKLLLMLFFIFILSGLEGLAHYFHVLIHVHWKIWWSFTVWTAIHLFLVGFSKVFRRILFKGELNI
jgi:hypothetical protein